MAWQLDHHLFYEGVELDVIKTVAINPYLSATAGLLPRLAHRLLDGSPEVRQLLPKHALPDDARLTAVEFRREWVRFASPVR